MGDFRTLMGWGAASATVDEREALAKQLSVLASPIRLALLDRLARPAFAFDLEKEFDLTRQALKKHLDQLIEAGLVEAQPGKRGIFPATEFLANGAAVFGLKQEVNALATPPSAATPRNTLPGAVERVGAMRAGPGIVAIVGRRAGEWFALDPDRPNGIGRDPDNEVVLTWDSYASARHAVLERSRGGWSVLDLSSRNGTSVDFEPLARGAQGSLRDGGVLGIGKSLFVLRA